MWGLQSHQVCGKKSHAAKRGSFFIGITYCELAILPWTAIDKACGLF